MPSSTNTSRRNKPERVLSERELNRATLARQLLLERSALKPLAAIEQLAGLQAQVPRPPFLGLWSRLAQFTRDDLHALFIRKQAVRATMMRGTIHVVSARDYLAWRPMLQPMLSRAGASILKGRVTIDVPTLVAFAEQHLPSTFAELRTEILRAFPGADERALAFTIRLHLPLVMEPTETRWSFAGNARFAHAPTFLGKQVGTKTALDALVLRYLRAFGPATVKDAQTWSGDRTLGPVFERLRPSLVTFADEHGRELFDLPDAPRPDADTLAPIRYLPDFDNLMLSHDDRSRIVDDAHRPSMTSTNGIVYATYLVDGRIAGKWTMARGKQTASITLVPYTKLTKPVRAELEREGEQLLRFAEPDATTFAVTVAR